MSSLSSVCEDEGIKADADKLDHQINDSDSKMKIGWMIILDKKSFELMDLVIAF